MPIETYLGSSLKIPTQCLVKGKCASAGVVTVKDSFPASGAVRIGISQPPDRTICIASGRRVVADDQTSRRSRIRAGAHSTRSVDIVAGSPVLRRASAARVRRATGALRARAAGHLLAVVGALVAASPQDHDQTYTEGTREKTWRHAISYPS